MLLAPGVTVKFNGGPVGAGEEKWSILTSMINYTSHLGIIYVELGCARHPKGCKIEFIELVDSTCRDSLWTHNT